MRKKLLFAFIGMVFCVLFLATPGFADIESQTIDFDDSRTAPLAIRYQDLGILLQSSYNIIPNTDLSSQTTTYSEPNSLTSQMEGEFPSPGPLTVLFTYDVFRVCLYTGIPFPSLVSPSLAITLKAFDEYDNLLDTQSTEVIPPSDITTQLCVGTPTNMIRKIDLQTEGLWGEYMDDLTFWWESGEEPPLPTTPPVVSITSPTENETITGEITISGTIHGEGLLPDLNPPSLVISYPVDPTSTDPSSFESYLYPGQVLQWINPPGSGSQPYLAFSYPVMLRLGKNTITVKAANIAGTESAQTSITYFPQAIRDKYQQEGARGRFGVFKWGLSGGNCTSAIYQYGAIFTSSAGTYSVDKPIFDKSRKSPFGCPISAQRPVENEFGVEIGVAQDFVGGRVYYGPSTKPSNERKAYYVTDPFLDAIDKLEADSIFLGLPATDPVTQNKWGKPGLPILWQKFERPVKLGVTITSSMEVTESSIDNGKNPLTLWVATPDLYNALKVEKNTVEKIGELPDALALDFNRIPTVWYSYPCAKLGEACINVRGPASTQKLPYSKLGDACDDGHYSWSLGVPQWAPLAPGKIVPFIGTVSTSGLSDSDASWNHDCSICEPSSLDCFAGVDWCIHLVPDPGFEYLLGDDRSRGEIQDTLEVEYEWCLAGYPEPKDYNDQSKGSKDNLQLGEKVFVAGRWISDCGCHPWYSCSNRYKSEIHPPAVMIRMYTDSWDTLRPMTVGEIVYFDWWYPHETVEVDIYPPPRPSPDVRPTFSVPRWKDFCPGDGGKCGIQYSLEPAISPNHIHLKISGRPDVRRDNPQSKYPPHTPPLEDKGNGQLYHGYLPCPEGWRCAFDPYYPHTLSLEGVFEARW